MGGFPSSERSERCSTSRNFQLDFRGWGFARDSLLALKRQANSYREVEMTVAELCAELATVPQDLEVFCGGSSIQDWIIYNFQCDGVGGRYVDLMSRDGYIIQDDIAEETSRG